ncbi:hypothetical protein [Pedobacter sp. B4-66]|uniref:hypothetical protein n=1 Tax=Pedobacter sp. B4-66 TaxID=2817280 RepID=UPI001BDB139E|nr:hypothetical protein [Pedobacter sp. B4-66]
MLRKLLVMDMWQLVEVLIIAGHVVLAITAVIVILEGVVAYAPLSRHLPIH